MPGCLCHQPFLAARNCCLAWLGLAWPGVSLSKREREKAKAESWLDGGRQWRDFKQKIPHKKRPGQRAPIRGWRTCHQWRSRGPVPCFLILMSYFGAGIGSWTKDRCMKDFVMGYGEICEFAKYREVEDSLLTL